MVLWTIKTVSSWAAAVKTPPSIRWLMRSAEEDNGKPSGKRLSGGLAMLLVAYIVISGVSFGTPINIELVAVLLGFAAACFAISYIPTRGTMQVAPPPPADVKKCPENEQDKDA